MTYSNEAKTAMPGVDADLIAGHGAVGGAVVRAMAQGALKHSKAPVAVAVTGVADPSGGSVEKPVGTVWFGFSVGSQLISAMRLVPSTTENSVCRRRWTNIQY